LTSSERSQLRIAWEEEWWTEGSGWREEEDKGGGRRASGQEKEEGGGDGRIPERRGKMIASRGPRGGDCALAPAAH